LFLALKFAIVLMRTTGFWSWCASSLSSSRLLIHDGSIVGGASWSAKYWAAWTTWASPGFNRLFHELKVRATIASVLILERPEPDFTPRYLRPLNCYAVKGRAGSDRPWEYYVYDPWRLEIIAWEPYFPRLGRMHETKAAESIQMHAIKSRAWRSRPAN
jgi:hypothetical protein